MTIRHQIGAALAVLSLTGIGGVPAGAAEPSATTASAAKITYLAKASGYAFTAKTDTVWYADWHGKTLKNFRVVLAVEGDLMVAFVTAATKPQFEVTPEFLQTLLKFNNSLDFVKVGLDRDGDIFVRSDSSVRTLDAQAFKEVVDQVAASTDEVYAGIAPYLVSK
jgi:hypothetical protein